MQLKKNSLGSLISVFVTCSLCMAQIPEGYEKGFSTIDQKEILKNISVLAADSMKGRPAGSPENLIAARFIAEKFRHSGLKPLFPQLRKNSRKAPDGEESNELSVPEDPSLSEQYLQKLTIKKYKLSEKSSLRINRSFAKGSSVKSYKNMTDFLVQFTIPENLNVAAPVVFAGYGIDKGENGYSDYLDNEGSRLDVKNKIVLVVDGFPLERDTASVFSKSRNALYRNPLRKADLAAEKGALAMIIVNSPFRNDPPVSIKYEKLLTSFQREDFCLPEIERKEIPVFYISSAVLNDLFAGTGGKLKELLESTDRDLKARSFEIADKKVEFEISFDEKLLNTQNVAGFIEGTDPELKNEFVVIGAHYDHVGLGEHGAGIRNNIGKIHNGADDNASGVSGMLQIAKAFSKAPAKRSVLFVAFTGEENGMLGSRYYAHIQPLRPIEKTVAMLNLDMIGRNETNELFIGGAFYSSDLIKVVQKANQKLSMNLFYNTGLLTSASDQAPFLRKGIPALFFFSGLHDDYHMPEDDVEKINPEKVEKASKLAFLTAWITGNESSKPAYKEVSMSERTEIVRESMTRQNKLKQKK